MSNSESAARIAELEKTIVAKGQEVLLFKRECTRRELALEEALRWIRLMQQWGGTLCLNAGELEQFAAFLDQNPPSTVAPEAVKDAEGER